MKKVTKILTIIAFITGGLLASLDSQAERERPNCAGSGKSCKNILTSDKEQYK